MSRSGLLSKEILIRLLKCGIFVFHLLVVSHFSFGQCPSNIDFESGDFTGWKLYTGVTDANFGQNQIFMNQVPAPVPDRHRIISAATTPQLDEFGGFPKLCPNGSGYSVLLGNNDGAGQAEGISYEFTIPPTANKYSISYNYAVVIQDPGHQDFEQPRMKIQLFNVSDNAELNCSSFSFVAGGGLPGFQTSPIIVGNSPVLFKDWSGNTINLDGLAGKTIRFSATTTDCIFEAHFGYAYLDITAQCSSELSGAIFCADDPFIDVVAPFGYQSYQWLSSNFSQVLGTGQTLHLDPPPLPGTMVALDLIPYPGYGCRDTILQVLDTIQVRANAGADHTPCNLEPVMLGGASVPGFTYQWTPDTDLSSAGSPNPFATPTNVTDYTLTVQSVQGGCFSQDTVHVDPQIIDKELVITGNRLFCLGNPDAAVLRCNNADSVQWMLNGEPIPGAIQLQWNVTQSGTYYALLYNTLCSSPVMSELVVITVDTADFPERYPTIEAAQNFPVRLQARDFGNGYAWTPATNLDLPNTKNPYFRGLQSQQYLVTISTPSGCVTTDTLLVKTYKKIEIYVPSMFTPNGDGLNDYLRPLLMGFKKVNHFRIFNRWGQLMFESDNDLPGWDGRFRNQLQESQTVVWIIEAEDIDGKVHHRTGTSILRY